MTERGVEKRGLNCSEAMENLTKLPVLDEKKERKWHSADFINQLCLIQKENNNLKCSEMYNLSLTFLL